MYLLHNLQVNSYKIIIFSKKFKIYYAYKVKIFIKIKKVYKIFKYTRSIWIFLSPGSLDYCTGGLDLSRPIGTVILHFTGVGFLEVLN